jgi:diadenosine tetraphosphate (Ap4A) HIT family hydrolase
MSDEAPCPFCARVNGAGAPAVALDDAYPLADRHRLVVPRRHAARLEDLPADEWHAVFEIVRVEALRLAADADGVTIGVNSGEAAGQTVAHAHVHVIPRVWGDVPDPRGGVRWVLPERAAYWGRR